VALGVALPILLILIAVSLINYWRERQLLEDQVRLTALLLGEMVMDSLHHAMLTNNQKMVAETLVKMGELENIQQVQIVGLDRRVRAHSDPEQVGRLWDTQAQGCIECHQYPPESRPRTMRFVTLTDMLRISVPIINEPECASCHTERGAYLGVLLTDVSVVNIEERLQQNLQVNLAISIAITLLVTLSVYLLIHWLVVRRVEAFRHPLAKFAVGDFSARLPTSPGPTDELGELANSFNYMADELKGRARRREERRKSRERAVAAERARIARDLHDGMAQLLGYVNTKAMAVRLSLKNQQMAAADKNLLQLEEAARELFVDIRAAILDLKMTGGGDANLTATLNNFITQFSRLSDLPVEVTLAESLDSLPLTIETEQQLLRIVQESLTNVRKHASAGKAYVSLQTNGRILEMTIRDDGQGFDPESIWAIDQSHFGLTTMSERAEEIGAEFILESKPGAGTSVIVRLPLDNTS